MGRIKKGEICSVVGCNNPAVKSISHNEFLSVQTNLSVDIKGSKVYLCKDHYKVFKKAIKSIKRLEKWRLSRF